MTRDHLRAARAILVWALETHRIWPREYSRLVGDVCRRENLLEGCGKVGFASFQLAARMAKNRRGKDGHRRRVAYKCWACGLFHMGSVQESRDRRAAKEFARA